MFDARRRPGGERMSATAGRRGQWTLDLAIVAALAALAVGVLLAPAIAVRIEWLVGVPFLVFLPGYAVIAALFPGRPGGTSRGSIVGSAGGNGSPGWAVRVALSLVMSAVVVAVVGVAASATVGIRLAPVAVAIGAVTLLGVAVAAVRRGRLARERRANPLTGSAFRTFSPGTSIQTASLVLALLVLVGAVAFVGAVPMEGESYTESYLLNEGEDGDLVAEGHPTEFVAGVGHPLYVGLENHEHRTVSYEVVVLAQEVDADGSITDQRQVDRFGVELDHAESDVVEREIAPTTTGEGIRLQFLVYEGTDPANAEDADQTLQLWIDVVEEGDG